MATPGHEDGKPEVATRTPRFLTGSKSGPVAQPARFHAPQRPPEAAFVAPLKPTLVPREAANGHRPAPVPSPNVNGAGALQSPSAQPAHPHAQVQAVQQTPVVPSPAVQAPPPPARQSLPDSLKLAIDTLRLQSERLAEQARADALEIAFQIAQKIVEGELHTSPEPFFALVRAAVKQVGESRKVRVRVNPGDVAALKSPRGMDSLAAVSLASIEVIGDASLQHGDCVIDTDFGQVDGRLATRFQELKRALQTATEGVA